MRIVLQQASALGSSFQWSFKFPSTRAKKLIVHSASVCVCTVLTNTVTFKISTHKLMQFFSSSSQFKSYLDTKRFIFRLQKFMKTYLHIQQSIKFLWGVHTPRAYIKINFSTLQQLLTLERNLQK